MYLTYKYRIKDSVSRKRLEKLAGTVNFVWNYINELHKIRFRQYKQGGSPKFLSAYDVNSLLNGCGKELKIAQQTAQGVAEEYVSSRKTHKKNFLKWRSARRSLGWIPFKNQTVKVKEDEVIYLGEIYRIYKDRSLPEGAKILCGSFNQDSRGRWFVSITFEAPLVPHIHLNRAVGIDLGIKAAINLSDGTAIPRPDLTARYADRLARAQRARKKKLTTAIHSKIKNARNDFYQKATTKIVKENELIVIGNVRTAQMLGLKNMRKSLYDASWHRIKLLLEYKAQKLGGKFVEVSERYTTQDCSSCSERTGPKGPGSLSVREWICSACGTNHSRDTNSAINILRLGQETLTGNL